MYFQIQWEGLRAVEYKKKHCTYVCDMSIVFTVMSVSEDIAGKVTCPRCRKFYEFPRVLPCLHCYCSPCLEKLEKDQEVDCDICHSCHAVSNVQDLPVATVIADLADFCQEYQRVMQSYTFGEMTECDICKCPGSQAIGYCKTCKKFTCELCYEAHMRWPNYRNHDVVRPLGVDCLPQQPSQRELFCKRHSHEKLNLFCYTCHDLICRDCTLRSHEGHKFSSVQQAFWEQKGSVVSTLGKLSTTLDTVKAAIDDASSQIVSVTESQKRAYDQIWSTFNERMQALCNTRKRLTDQVTRQSFEKLEKLQLYNSKMESIQSKIRAFSEFVSSHLMYDSPKGVIAMETIIARQKLLQEVNTISLELKELSFANRPDFNREAISVEFNRSFDEFQPPDLLPSPSSDVIPLRSPPVSLIDVQCFLPKVDGKPVRVIDGIVRPSAIFVDNKLAICQLGSLNQVTLLSMKGEKLLSVGKECEEPLSCPCGIAVDSEGKILVTDDANHKLKLFSADGKCLKTVGYRGSSLELKTPVGIALTPSGQVLICERDNHCVQLLNSNLTHAGTFGKRGYKPGEFNHPCDIAVDPLGRAYVADCFNHRIQVFSIPDGGFLYQFGCKGAAPGELHRPSGICVDSDGFVYVSERKNHRISIFSSNGTFIKTIGKRGTKFGELNEPIGISVNENKVLYVCDFGNDRVHVYK